MTRDMSGRPEAKSERQEILALTGLRFIAAFSVALAHGSLQIYRVDPPTSLNYWLTTCAGFGMTLFFVLSGFVIHYNYRRIVTEGGWNGLSTFMWARFARLYPLYLFMLVLDVLLGRNLFLHMMGTGSSLEDVLRALPYYFLLIQSWVYVPFNSGSLVYVIGPNIALSWSISTEWFFYLAYPVIAVLVLRARRLPVILAAILAFNIVWISLALTLDNRAQMIDAWAVRHYGPLAGFANGYQDSFFRWIAYFSPYSRIGEFILGCLTAQLFLQLRERPVSHREHSAGMLLLALGVLSVPLVMFLTYSPAHYSSFFQSLRSNFGLAPSVALIIFGAARYDNPVARFFRHPRLVAWGEASYSIYLIHFLIYIVISSYLGQALPPTAPNLVFLGLRFAFVLSLIVLIAMGLHAFLEVPARAWLRGLWRQPAARGRRRFALVLAATPAMAALLAIPAANALFPGAPIVTTGIRLTSATYGLNCGAKAGNATREVSVACNGKESCDYRVDVNVLGDPGQGCAKAFTATYDCLPGERHLTQDLPGEAGLGSHLLLACFTASAQTAAGTQSKAVAAVPSQPAPTITTAAPSKGIKVITATYGENCGGKAGNATQALSTACNGKETCDYRVDFTVFGDPKQGCAKAFMAAYACLPDGRPLTQGLPGEAGLGSHLLLLCSATQSDAVPHAASDQPRR